ncbi:DUF2637 domain-containing protein [Streptomyces yokosukanensis]|uniref:DUF2637 domain-containing protein n=1 Tax=Streptomyces yokosukanensis TaxID=67386 RepID=UPI000B0F1BC5|nr:DUF2637 domain-containing protein [Streptomyces yokosukanensis]
MTAAKEPTSATPTRAQRMLIAVVTAGAALIAGIGFAGSYAAVRELAVKKGFGNFSYVFPVGIDAGICVLLSLDLLLTWIRIPFPLLRQTAWLLTAATIAFNGAAAWPDPLGVGMHAVIPILFVVAVEAARHAVGRIADITADKHMEGVRIMRWLLSPVPTFLLWRRMKLWELRSYEQVIKLEQERLVYQARLQARFGRAWRRKAPVESLMPLRLARYGVPLVDTAPAGLAAARIKVPRPQPEPPVQHEAVALAGFHAHPFEQVTGRDTLWSTPHHSVPSPPGVSQFEQMPHPSREGGASARVAGKAPGESGDGEALHIDRATNEAVVSPWEREQQYDAAELHSSRRWNVSSDTASDLEREDSSPAFHDVLQDERAGVAADLTGGPTRHIVQMRIPDGPSEPEAAAPQTSSDEVEDQSAADGDQPQAVAAPPVTPDDIKGVELVEWHYRHLPEGQRRLSANALAPQLVEMTGYKQSTVRKYIGDIRKADARAAQAAEA